jgi:hypothetical protein
LKLGIDKPLLRQGIASNYFLLNLTHTHTHTHTNEKKKKKKKIKGGIDRQKSDWEGFLSHLNGRIEILRIGRDEMRLKFDNQDGRQCDLDAIQNLQEHLKTLKYHLSAKVTGNE